MLERLAKAAESGSLILLRTTFKDAGWRYLVTLLEEWWTRVSGWISGDEVNFPHRRELVSFFKNRGLGIGVTPLWGKTPFGGELVVIEKSRPDTNGYLRFDYGAGARASRFPTSCSRRWVMPEDDPFR
jgi:hypothetical protein